MKIQFVFAPPAKMPKFGEMCEETAPPLGILYLAGYLRKHIPGLDIRAIDGPRTGYAETLAQVSAFEPQVLCVSYYVVSALGAYKMINTLKQNNPDLLCIVGGHHVTALPGEALTRSAADIEVYGEGEETLTEIIKAYMNSRRLAAVNLGRIEGIGYLKNNTVQRTPERPFIDDLDTIPFPARDLIDMNAYTGWYITKQAPQARMIFARGCPYHCTFCSNKVWKRRGSGVRIRSARNIVDELEMLKNEYGVKEFFDDGDEFNNNVPRALEICKEIKRRNLGMTWKCQLRCNNLPEALVRAMAEAGCWFVHLGIESGNQRTLDGIKKQITLSQAENACQLLKKYGIKTLGLFMLFNVWEENHKLCHEGVKETNNTLIFANRLLHRGLLTLISSAQTQPYPGSELYDIAIRHDLIKEHLKTDWDAWLRDDMYVMALPGIKDTQMAAMRTKANLIIALQIIKSGYLLPKHILFYGKRILKLLDDNLKAKFHK